MKNEPPYLATTLHVIFVDCDLVAIIYWQPLSSVPITLDVWENTLNFVSLCCSFLWCHLYYKLVCNLGFKTRFRGCSRKGGHENRSQHSTITPNGNIQHFIFKHVKHTFEYILLSTCLCHILRKIHYICYHCIGKESKKHHWKYNRKFWH
jgi:hypothetical protein